MHTVSFSVSSTIEKQLRANLSWAFARLQHYDAELLDAVAVAAHRCVYGEVGVLGMAMEMGRWRFLQAFLFWRMMMTTTTGYVSSSNFLEDFDDSHMGGNISTRHRRGHCQVKSCPASCGASLRLWSPRVLTSFPIFVKHWCKGLGPGLVVGSWKDSIFVLLHFHFQRFAGLIM